jgi:DNA-binding transcriptional LysR family regulator
MDLRHIGAFIAVAEELSFTRASKRLRLSQPPLSKLIRNLEEELGVVLLERTSRSVRLTPAGRMLLNEGKLLLLQAASVIERTKQTGNPLSQCVRIGFATGLGDALQSALMRHLNLHPGAEVHFKNILSAAQNDALRDREIDIGLMRPLFDSETLDGEELYEERLMALVPKHHPLAKSRSISLRELAEETILLHKRSDSVGVYDKVIELLRQSGIQPKLVQTRTGPYEEAGTVLVASGRGIYIAGGLAISHPGASRAVRAVPISDRNAGIGIFMAWRKGEHAPNVLAFLNSLRLALKK